MTPIGTHPAKVVSLLVITLITYKRRGKLYIDLYTNTLSPLEVKITQYFNLNQARDQTPLHIVSHGKLDPSLVKPSFNNKDDSP